MCTKKVYSEKKKNACQNGVAEFWKIMKKFGVRSKLYISIVWHCKIAVKSHKLCVKISFWYIPEIIDKRNKQIFSQWSRRGGEGQASFSGNSWGFPQLPHLGKYCNLSPPNMT